MERKTLAMKTEKIASTNEENGAAEEHPHVEHGHERPALNKRSSLRDLHSLAATSRSLLPFCPGSRMGCLLCALFLILAAVVVVCSVIWQISSDDDVSTSDTVGIVYFSKTASPTPIPHGVPGTLNDIFQRGVLRCGVWEGIGRAVRSNKTGQLEGFSVDLCQTISAAIFGADKVSLDLKVVQASNRFEILNSGEVDVLASWDTYTMQRDLAEPTTGVGFTFSVPYFYDGMVFAGIPVSVKCASSKNVTNCKNLSFCVMEGTTHVSLVKSKFPKVPVTTSIDYQGVYRDFQNGVCNVLAGDQFSLAESTIRAQGYKGTYLVSNSVLSHEPLSLVTRDGDEQWSDFVNWIIEAMFTAEQMGFTQITSLNSFQKTDLFGPNFREMFVNALSVSGNYRELYNRHFKTLAPELSINTLNEGSTGLMYSYALGEIEAEGPGLRAGSTISKILGRGTLRCGILNSELFAMIDQETGGWWGFDVDFCRALSAALFLGDDTIVEYVDCNDEERFMTLQNGTVDVLSRVTTVTYDRDVKETTSQKGLTFSRPNFYDGLGFGGIPPYLQCADNLDVLSPECKDLKICVNTGTTFLTIMQNLLPHRFLVPTVLSWDVPAGLENGNCNVIAGGVGDVAHSNVVNYGNYTGEYATGTKRFSSDPLALVTREDDPQWSSFVFWTVMAVFYAEEQGITKETAHLMPTCNLFGSHFKDFFRNIVGAVGSYSEIYERNVQAEVSRGATNLLNEYPFGPQHFPLPGLVE